MPSTRDDGTPAQLPVGQSNDWCENAPEVINQLRINTDNSHHRYDVILLINGIPVVQIELKTLGINPRRAMEQVVDYKTDSRQRLYARCSALCRSSSSATSRPYSSLRPSFNARHFAFHADEHFLPIYEHAAPGLPARSCGIEAFAEAFVDRLRSGR